ncbi:helix-turn-helix domain-containing protein [Gordonia soli]|uniref:Putative transcriptional regulator n=1 Tax=Gordonia soli NBRC 108243 TaxID=1223545 RepID=M0QRQ6_9ACTN|nr:helix-turn-helix transcriptional regulator [Gordonia soli]GAC70247.1 putative transcriptional regulator [Gordonia soli NBRC 108243]
MASPLGDFLRARRDSTAPEAVGLPPTSRRRAPGLRRAELATRAGISVEYLTRIEQGRDRNPSVQVVNALADALALDVSESEHLRYLTKITGGACIGHRGEGHPTRSVRPPVLRTLNLLEPGVAMVTNRLGDVLAHTDAFARVMRPSGLLDEQEPNMTRHLFVDDRAKRFFLDRDEVADHQVFDLRLGPSESASAWFVADLTERAGDDFAARLSRHLPPPDVPWRLAHPSAGTLTFERETLHLPSTDAQEIVVLLPADAATERGMAILLDGALPRPLRVG